MFPSAPRASTTSVRGPPPVTKCYYCANGKQAVAAGKMEAEIMILQEQRKGTKDSTASHPGHSSSVGKWQRGQQRPSPAGKNHLQCGHNGRRWPIRVLSLVLVYSALGGIQVP